MSVKFLVVDDDQAVLDTLGAMLQSLGCDVETVQNGKTALEILQSPTRAQEFSAIFLDLMMNDINGYEVLQKLRAQPHTYQIPIIMLTAFDKSSGFVEAFQKGANYYITKPFTKEQIVLGLDMILGSEEHAEGEAPKKAHSVPEDW